MNQLKAADVLEAWGKIILKIGCFGNPYCLPCPDSIKINSKECYEHIRRYQLAKVKEVGDAKNKN